MKFQNIKHPREIVIEGHAIEFDRTGDTLNGVTISKDGKPVFRVMLRSYAIACERPADPKQVEKFKVTGTLAGIPVEKTFDTHSDAYAEKLRLEDAVITGVAEIEVETITVKHDDDLPF